MWDMQEKAMAKINLSLDVGTKREDGYHELCSVMHTVSLCDDVYLRLLSGRELRVTSNIPGLPGGEKNLAGKAVRILGELVGREIGAEIHIEKRIPSEAGLGGGSADAGAVLRMLGKALELDVDTLLRAAARIGADVPFCTVGGCALCRGIGERMQPLPPMPDCHIVIAKPPVGAPTGAVFAAFDGAPTVRSDSAAVEAALRAGDLSALCAALGNALAEPGGRVAPAAGETAERIRALGAMGACLSGSGTAAYGIFTGATAARQAVDALRAEGLFAAEARPLV